MSQSQRDKILLKEAKEESLFKMELCQTIKDSNKVFVDAMTDMSKYFMLMAETMKISMQQMTMIQQQQPQHSMVSAYQPTHHSHLYSVQQPQQRAMFHAMNNAHQPNKMSTSPQTMSRNAPPHTVNPPQQTMNSQNEATSETFLSSLRDFNDNIKFKVSWVFCFDLLVRVKISFFVMFKRHILINKVT